MSSNRRDNEILHLCGLIARNKNLKLTIDNSMKGALVTGVGALLGGLLGGSRGLAIGGVAGAIYSGVSGSGEYKSVIDVIKEDMTEQQKKELADAVWAVIRTINPSYVVDAMALLSIVCQNSKLEGDVIDAMKNFFSSKMNRSLV